MMSKLNIKHILIMVALATVMGSCNIYKSFELPKEGIVGEYAEAKNEAVDSTALGNLSWKQLFTDPQLQGLIQLALDNNVDLKNAKLNVDIAQAQLLGAKLSYLPSLAFNPNGAGASYAGSAMSWTYQLPLAASWEIDIFAKITNAKRKAQANLMQSEAYQQAVRSQIIGAVANTYYALVTLEKQYALYKETAGKWRESVNVMKQMKEAGRYTEVAVVQSIANYNSVMASIPEIEMSIHEMNNTMSLLLNDPTQKWILNLELNPLVLETALEGGVPMSYLAARPDVKSAEQTLAMAYYATNSARAAFYPSLSISALGGFTNLVGGLVTNPGKWFIQLAGQLSAPLFARGQNIQNLKVTKAQQQQAMNNFEHSLLNASADVSDALVKTSKMVEKQRYLKIQVENLEKAVMYNEDLQTLGTTTYLEVLNAQQSLLSSQIQMLTNELTISQASINLYQSLGGAR
ncbi:MAG: TolC family protein [Muribaculaceae bacterium]|nr:TolC family protein [Muribaculaceae bacterium]